MSDVLLERLQSRVVIFDGAIGTEIYRRNFFVNTSFEGLCLSAPQVIREIHQSYVEAGADVLTCNSYGANANKLSHFGLAEKMAEINRTAVQLAREAAGPDTLIAASVGPAGDDPSGKPLDEEAAVGCLCDQLRTLQDAGADFVIFETLPTLADALRARRAAEQATSIPYVLSLTVDRNGDSALGEPLEKLLTVLRPEGRPPTALGLNCGEGPESTLAALEKLMPLVSVPVIAQPNAGVPKHIDGRTLYMTSPEYFTTYCIRYVNLGVRGVGGCCGTGPEHIRDMVRSVRPLAASEYRSRRIAASIHTAELPPPAPLAERSAFGAKLAVRQWVTSVEIVPPRGYDLDPIVRKAAQCRAAGIDAINIPDGPRASSRISPIITAIRVQEQAGIDVILHFCSRDKNLIGMQADLLGCAAAGLHNILFITGDPPKLGDYPFASGVFDADSIGMTRIQNGLNRGVDLGGKPFAPPTRAVIGAGADPSALDMNRELRRTREKVEAGAEFIITQPVFAVDALLKFLDSIADLNVPVIAGVWPLASLRNAEFMKNEVPGVVVPDAVMTRMARHTGRDDQLKEGIQIARETVDAMRARVRGVQVSAPFGNVATALAVLAV